VHVLTRLGAGADLALRLGVASAGGREAGPPEPLDAAILFAPGGGLVPAALAALDRGGTLAIAGIHLSDVPSLTYQEHLFYERTLRSVTANTRRDGREFLAFAGRHRLRVSVTEYPLAAADRALADLAADRVTGAAVLVRAEDLTSLRRPPMWDGAGQHRGSSVNASRRGFGAVRNLPIVGKLASTVAVVCLMLIVVGVVGVGELSNAQDRLRDMHRVNLQAIACLDDVAFDFSQLLHEVDGLVLAGNDADARQALERIRSVDESLDRDWAAFRALPVSANDTALNAFTTSLASYRRFLENDLLRLAQNAAGDPSTFVAVRGQVSPLTGSVLVALDSLARSVDKDAQRSLDASQTRIPDRPLLIVALIVLAVALAASWW
jgi:hypothetical protein